MTDRPIRKPPRVLLTSLPAEYKLPAKPSRASAAVLDAHRQTGFLLGDDLALFERTMNEILARIATSRPRGPRAAAMLSVGGRAYSHLTDACMLMSYGSYASCPPLVRMALEAIAVQQALIGDDFGPYEDWYEHAVSQDGAAVRIDLGHSKAASVLVADENLGELYRLLMDLAMPHFGSALLFAAPETSLQKVPLAFADNSFHLGLAQLITSWLLQLTGRQLSVALDSNVFETDNAFRTSDEAIQRDIAATVANRQRCYVERSGDGWVFHNFRRSPSGQPKRVMLG